MEDDGLKRNLEHWEILLTKVLCPITSVIKEATEIIKEKLTQPETIQILFQLIRDSKDERIQHLSAVLCRMRIKGHWRSLNDPTRQSIKQFIIDTLRSECQKGIILRSIIELAGKIARASIEYEQWPELYSYVFEAANSERVSQREIGVYLLNIILRSSGVREFIFSQDSQITLVLQLLSKTLHDPTFNIRVISVECINSLRVSFDSSTLFPSFFNSTIHTIMTIIHQGIIDNDSRVSVGFEVLDFLAEEHFECLSNSIPSLCKFMITILSDNNVDEIYRQKAIYFIDFMISYKCKTFLETNFLENTLLSAFRICCESIADDDDCDENMRKFGEELIRSISISIPSKYYWDLFQGKVIELINTQNASEISTAVSAFGLVTEGCKEKIEDNLNIIMEIILTKTKDQNERIRDSCYYSLGEIIRYIPDKMKDFQDYLMPVLLEGLSDTNEDVRIKSCSCISKCCHSFDEDFLVTRSKLLFQSLLQLIRVDSNLEVKELAFSTLTTLINRIGSLVADYIPHLLAVMLEFLKFQYSKETLIIRGRTLECIGVILYFANNVEYANLKEILSVSVDCLSEGDVDLRYFTYVFLESFIRTKHSSLIVPFLPELMPYVFASCESNEAIYIIDDNQNQLLESLGEDDRDNDSPPNYKILPPFMQEKVQSITTIGWFAETLSDYFSLYLEKALLLIPSLINYIDSEVVSTSIIASVQLLKCLKTVLYPELPKDQKIYQFGSITPLHETLLLHIHLILDKLICSKEFEDSEIIQSKVEAIGKITLLFGGFCIHPKLYQIAKFFTKILRKQTEFQLFRESVDNSFDDKNDYTLYQSLMNSLIDISLAMGNHFSSFFEAIFPLAAEYLDDKHSVDYRTLCLDTIANCILNMNGNSSYLKQILELSLSWFHSSSLILIPPAVDCVRAIIIAVKEHLFPLYPSICNELLSLAKRHPEEKDLLESICATLSRMCLLNFNDLPLEAIVNFLLSVLPVTIDFIAAPVIYDFITRMIRSSNPLFMSNLASFVAAMAIQVSEYEDNLDADTILTIESTLKGIISRSRGDVELIFRKLLETNKVSEMYKLQSLLELN